jgi:hypothetical protein
MSAELHYAGRRTIDAVISVLLGTRVSSVEVGSHSYSEEAAFRNLWNRDSLFDGTQTPFEIVDDFLTPW